MTDAECATYVIQGIYAAVVAWAGVWTLAFFYDAIHTGIKGGSL